MNLNLTEALAAADRAMQHPEGVDALEAERLAHHVYELVEQVKVFRVERAALQAEATRLRLELEQAWHFFKQAREGK